MSAPLRNDATLFNGLVLIDDDSLLLEIVTWITKSSSYQTQLFSDTNDALEFLLANTPRLLIVDYYMPGISGIELVNTLAKEVSLADTAIYLCSALPPSEVTDDVLAEHNICLLHKDVVCARDSLLPVLEQHLATA